MTTGKNTNSNSLTTSCSFSPISLCHPAIMHRKMSSPHFELFSSKIPDPQVPSVVAFCRFKNCHCWVLIVLVVSLSGLISTSSTDSQLPFDFLTCPEVFPVYWSLFLWGIWQSHNVSLEIITQYDHDIQDQTESRNSLWNHLLGMENAHL